MIGKGRRPRACPFGHKTGQALDRYMRVRAKRADASDPWLRLGKWGRLTETGFERAVKHHGRAAELPDIHPHQFATPTPTCGSPPVAPKAAQPGRSVVFATRLVAEPRRAHAQRPRAAYNRRIR